MGKFSRRFLVVSMCLLCAVGLSPAADPGPGGANEWSLGPDLISVSITSHTYENRSGDPLGHYVLVGDTITMTATASDPDKYSCSVEAGGDGVWYDYDDDVTSGNNATDHHMKWEDPTNDGEFTDPYGTTATFEARGYDGSANDVCTDTVTVTAYDYDRASDDEGVSDNDDGSAAATVDLKIWQITVTKNAAHDNDCVFPVAVPAIWGGHNLGWCVPNNPVGCTRNNWNCEFTGTIPAGPVPTQWTYAWKSKYKGKVDVWIKNGNRSQFCLRKATKLSGARLCALLHNAEWMTKTPLSHASKRSSNC